MLIVLQPADADEDTDHEIVQCVGHKMKDGLMHIRVLMESHDQVYKSYKMWAPLGVVFQDCEAEAIENKETNFLVQYAQHSVKYAKDENDMKLFTEIAVLTKEKLKNLFPHLGEEEKEEVDDRSQKTKCGADHDKKFDSGDYEEVAHGPFYFNQEQKWANEKCWVCDKEMATLKPKNQTPAMVCEHLNHEKGPCARGFLCHACYGNKQMTEKGRSRRRNTAS